MSTTIMLEDRSGCETDDDCGMRYWMNRIEGGLGVVPLDESPYLTVGKEVHEDFSMLAKLEDLSEANLAAIAAEMIHTAAVDPILIPKMEALYRRVGWMAAWGLFMEPQVRATYDTVFMEDELVLDRTPLWIAVTPDRILRNRTTGRLVYYEYKSTISSSRKWLDSWIYAIQLHLGLKAVEEELQETPAFAQIIGLMKGDTYGKSGHLSHPYVWAWFHEAKGTWSHTYQAAAGWAARPVWEYPGGPVAWVRECGEDVARSQFPHTMPIFLNNEMVQDFIVARTHRAEEIASVKDQCRTDITARNRYFRKKIKTCRPPFGDACPYLMACWHAPTAADPLASGRFKPREPHHELELTLRSGK